MSASEIDLPQPGVVPFVQPKLTQHVQPERVKVIKPKVAKPENDEFIVDFFDPPDESQIAVTESPPIVFLPYNRQKSSSQPDEDSPEDYDPCLRYLSKYFCKVKPHEREHKACRNHKDVPLDRPLYECKKCKMCFSPKSNLIGNLKRHLVQVRCGKC